MCIRAWRTAASLGLSVLLMSCGGGGSDSGAANGTPALSVSSRSLSAIASDPRAGIYRDLQLHSSEPVEVHLKLESGSEIITNIDLIPSSLTDATLRVWFRDPQYMSVGTHDDILRLTACLDSNCARQMAGSPVDIAIHYEVLAGSRQPAQVSLRSTYEVITAHAGQIAPQITTPVTITNPAGHALYFQAAVTGNGLESASYLASGSSLLTVLRTPADLPAGIHQGIVALSVCYDSACTAHVEGSPLNLAVSYEVKRAPEPDRPLLPLAESRTLDHDVIAAEYSQTLNLLIIASARPANALHLYDLSGGDVRSVNLGFPPTALKLRPDGRSVAVGHDARVSIVDIAASTPSVRLLNVSAPVFDLVYDSKGYVHVFPGADQGEKIHSIRISTNTESLSSYSIYEKTHAKLHPSGDSLYTMTTNLYPNDMEKFSLPLLSGQPSFVRDSPYHGDHEMCGNLWFEPAGNLIYTACGAIFRSSSSADQDMLYDGHLAVTDAGSYSSYRIQSLSQIATGGTLLLAEFSPSCLDSYNSDPCRAHVNIHADGGRQPTESYALANSEEDGVAYQQLPEHLFQSSDGRRYLLSRTVDRPTGWEYRLHRLQ